MQDFGTLRQPLLGELAMSRKREREKEKKQAGAELCQAQAKHAFSQQVDASGFNICLLN